MKRLLLLAGLLMVGLSGCYVLPDRGHDDGYRNGQDRHQHDNRNDHDHHDDGRDGGYGGHDGYH